MNKNLFLTLSAFLFLFPLSGKATGTYRPETSVAGFIQLPGSGRQVYDFNPGWRFFKGDISGAETVNFDDRSWEVVSTPHTVELMPAEASGCRNYQGPVWYRKHFVVPAETKGQRVSIHFEAAMGKQILYLNGKRIQEHIGGYLPFTLDLTTYGVQAGDSCLLAVFADNSDDKSYPPGKRQSANLNQPEILPDKYESGTPNLPGIAGLNAGIKFVLNKKTDRIYNSELGLARMLYKRLEKAENVILYTKMPEKNHSVPVISFNIKNTESETVAKILNDSYNIAVRAGLHCAPLAHKSFGTQDTGTVRAVVSAFTTKNDVVYFANAVSRISKNNKQKKTI